MYRNPIFSAGKYTVHYGKLSSGDSRDYWIEGPTLTGRMAPIASCYNEGDAIRRAKEMAAREVLVDTEEQARVKASEAFHDHPSNPSSCAAWEQGNSQRCPCEDGWRAFMKPEPGPSEAG